MTEPNYNVDQETHDLLDTALHLAAAVADLQRNPEDAEDIYNLLATLAERFNINREPFTDEEPFTDCVIPLRNFTVIHGDGPAVTDNESQTTEEN